MEFRRPSHGPKIFLKDSLTGHGEFEPHDLFFDGGAILDALNNKKPLYKMDSLDNDKFEQLTPEEEQKVSAK